MTTREQALGQHISYSCSRDECERCSQGTQVRTDFAPLCTHKCHQAEYSGGMWKADPDATYFLASSLAQDSNGHQADNR